MHGLQMWLLPVVLYLALEVNPAPGLACEMVVSVSTSNHKHAGAFTK